MGDEVWWPRPRPVLRIDRNLLVFESRRLVPTSLSRAGQLARIYPILGRPAIAWSDPLDPGWTWSTDWLSILRASPRLYDALWFGNQMVLEISLRETDDPGPLYGLSLGTIEDWQQHWGERIHALWDWLCRTADAMHAHPPESSATVLRRPQLPPCGQKRRNGKACGQPGVWVAHGRGYRVVCDAHRCHAELEDGKRCPRKVADRHGDTPSCARCLQRERRAATTESDGEAEVSDECSDGEWVKPRTHRPPPPMVRV